MSPRRIVDADLPALAALHARSFDRPWSAGELRDMAARPGAVALVSDGDDGEAPHGFILCWRTVDEAEILTLAVAPEARRAGLGRALVDTAATACQAEGARTLFLEVAEDNAAALALYRRAGFEEAGRRRGYYPRSNGAVDALVLRRALI